MLKAIGSKFDIEKSKDTAEFFEYIKELLESEVVQQMKKYPHHLSTTCFQHSLNVSYYNYIICKRLGLDAKAAARAGLLHDLFLYDRKRYHASQGEKMHGFRHPHIALYNASLHFELDRLEKDIIVKHMWPLTIAFPKYAETYVISLTDKYCGIAECAIGIKDKIKKAMSKRIPVLGL